MLYLIEMKEDRVVSELVFLKLGGSLITDKARSHTARLGVIQRLAAEVRSALRRDPTLRLVIGHGSGSFGHAAAKTYGFERGQPRTGAGFAAVAWAAAALNRLVADALHEAGIPFVVIAPSASGVSHHGELRSLALDPFRRALVSNLVPLTYGDVLWDDALGWSIASTETIFAHLARALRPGRIVLAGDVPGVMQPATDGGAGRLIAGITPQTWASLRATVHGAPGLDVTGGMASKVAGMVHLVSELPGMTVEIISGLEPGRVEGALVQQKPVPGTRISAAALD